MKKIKFAAFFVVACLACSFLSSCTEKEDEEILSQIQMEEQPETESMLALVCLL